MDGWMDRWVQCIACKRGSSSFRGRGIAKWRFTLYPSCPEVRDMVFAKVLARLVY